MNKNIQAILEKIAKEQCSIHNLELWGMEFSFGKGKKGFLRIYVDKENGVNIEELAQLSRDLEVVLDIEDVIPGSYTLEVSSPGLDRKFFNPLQLQKFIGQQIKVKTKSPINKQKIFKGELVKAKDNLFTLQINQKNMDFDFFETEKVTLEPKF
ncbi:MAG: ribosome maturation factor RimP [Desulfonauticus sp.]|nr:ribosome maturation factor RimP [Desulfonauticus sp.]